jgi:hypothetical protein
VADGGHITELAAAFGLAAGLARGALGRQACVQIGAQVATGLDVEALVDGFVAHPCQPVIGVIAGQNLGDQLRAPPIVHPRFDPGAQSGVGELELLRPLGLSGGTGMRHPGVVIAVGIAIAFDFAADDRPITTEPPGDLGPALAPIKTPHDLHPLVITDPVTSTTATIKITGLGQTSTTTAHQQLHPASVAPPQPRRCRRHAHLPLRRDQRRSLTHPVEQLSPRRLRMRITTWHDNPQSTDVVLTV